MPVIVFSSNSILFTMPAYMFIRDQCCCKGEQYWRERKSLKSDCVSGCYRFEIVIMFYETSMNMDLCCFLTLCGEQGQTCFLKHLFLQLHSLTSALRHLFCEKGSCVFGPGFTEVTMQVSLAFDPSFPPSFPRLDKLILRERIPL